MCIRDSYNGGQGYMSKDTINKLVTGDRSTYKDTSDKTPWHLVKVMGSFVKLSEKQAATPRKYRDAKNTRKIIKLKRLSREAGEEVKSILRALGVNTNKVKYLLNQKAN